MKKDIKFNIGDVRNGLKVLPKDERKTILLLSDDLRLSSGIATMSKEFVLGLSHRYNFVQLAAGIKHHDQGKMLDLSNSAEEQTGVPNVEIKLIPWDGYGNPQILRQLLKSVNPDAVMIFTDPRYWVWLFEMENEVRQQCPIIYYSIWDNLPDPEYNISYYESCDSILGISKQTYGIVKRLMQKTESKYHTVFEDWRIEHVPHGIDENVYKPLKDTEIDLKLKNKLFGDKEYDFVVFWMNRNIRRKQPSDVINAFKLFCERLPEGLAKRTALLMHTHPLDKNGTDLYAVRDKLDPIGDVIFSTDKLSQKDLNQLYNFADVTINIAGQEGHGLTTHESVMAGTPILLTVTGGLQDQCGFTLNGSPLGKDSYVTYGTFHNQSDWSSRLEWGEWALPVWPSAHTLIGSITTPYIYDDKVDVDEVSGKLFFIYSLPPTERKRRGMAGREWMINEGEFTSTHMCEKMGRCIDTTFQNWKPRKRYNLIKIT